MTKPPIIAIPPDTTLDIAELGEVVGVGVVVELGVLEPEVVFETTRVEVERVAEELPMVGRALVLEVVIVLFET